MHSRFWFWNRHHKFLFSFSENSLINKSYPMNSIHEYLIERTTKRLALSHWHLLEPYLKSTSPFNGRSSTIHLNFLNDILLKWYTLQSLFRQPSSSPHFQKFEQKNFWQKFFLNTELWWIAMPSRTLKHPQNSKQKQSPREACERLQTHTERL